MAIRYFPAFFVLLVVLFTAETSAVTSDFVPHTARAALPICTSEVCCFASCGTCGGDGCSKLPGGKRKCCADEILKNGPKCSARTTEGCVRTRNTPYPILKDGVFCAASCGTCGGSGCNKRRGGENKCCISTIKERGLRCTAKRIDGCVVRK